MFKVLLYMKKTWISVVVIILLLAVQAACDLALPDYTSKIVNVGIQQGGIENYVPIAIRKVAMQDILKFTDKDEAILSKYDLVSKDSSDFEKYVLEYSELQNQDIYVLKILNKDEIKEVEEVFKKPLVSSYVLKNEQMANIIKEKVIENMPDEQKQAFLNMPLEEVLNILPPEALEKIYKELDFELDNMQDMMIDQAAINVIKEEYKAIKMDIDKLETQYIMKAGIEMLGIALVSMISAVIVMFLSSRVAAKLANTLREKVFKNVLNFSAKEFREFSTASLITRSTNDIQQIQMLINFLFRVAIYAPIIGIGGLFHVILSNNTSMSWIIGIAIACILVVVGGLFAFTMPKFKKLQELVDKLNLVFREILTGLPVIRAFNTEKKEEKRFDTANKELMKTNMFVNSSMSMMMPLLMLIMDVITLLIVWVGAHKVDSGVMLVGDMMAFIQYTMQIVTSFLMISMISIVLPRATVSAKRINEVIDTIPCIQDKEKLEDFKEEKKGLIEFKDVSFRYPDADTEILEDITFTAKPGETTAIIGSTGSGKSTIVNLIPRFYDVTGGEIIIDGVNVKDVSQKKLREKIGFVPQKGVLFSGTIKSNIKYSNEDMEDEKMEKAASIAQAVDFIERKENKYDEEISQGGTNVSGGQRQRLSIARAIATNPEIFVFDDSFSALDLKTDKNLREALKKETRDKTVIIVAQRISTIMDADQIIVLEEGKIAGIGKHDKLMQTCEIYRQIALSQLSKEELENGK